MKQLLAWLQAARFPSQIYLLLPIWLGQLWAGQLGHPINDKILYLTLLFAFVDQLYIVFANDYADQEADALNESPTLFSGGSRVLVEAKISPAALLRAAQLAATGCFVISIVLATYFDRPWSVGFTVVALGLLWAYSFQPIQASYRGFGVFLQTAGIAVLLPLFGFYAQAGTLEHFPWIPLGVLALSQVSCAMATALPDIKGDRLANKQTLAVKLGHKGSQIGMALILLTAAAIQGLTIDHTPGQAHLHWVYIPVGFAIIAGIIPRAHTHIWRLGAVALTTIAGALSIELIYIFASI